MNYPYGLHPRTFQLSKREWAATGLQASTLGPATGRPLALTDAPSHADTTPRNGRTQIRPQPPSTSPKKRPAPRRSFLSVTDWSVSAVGDGNKLNSVYRNRKLHHLPPMNASNSPRAGRSSAVRARSIVRANQQAALHYEQALEAGERATLEHDEQRERHQAEDWLVAQLAQHTEPVTPVAHDEVVEEGERSCDVIDEHSLPAEQLDTHRTVPQSDDGQLDSTTELANQRELEVPPLCGCEEPESIDGCRRRAAATFVDDLLSRWDAAEHGVTQTHKPSLCGCEKPESIDDCRQRAAASFVEDLLSRWDADKGEEDALARTPPTVENEVPGEQEEPENVDGCHRLAATELVDDLLSRWTNGESTSHKHEEPLTQDVPVARDPPAAPVSTAGTHVQGCGCTSPRDVNLCRNRQATDLVALILDSPQAAPTAHCRPFTPDNTLAEDGLLVLRRREAETFVDGLLASAKLTPVIACSCTHNEKVRECRQAFLAEMLEDVLVGYV